MQRWRGIDATPADWGRSVITIGVFDGVHRGHQSIIGRAVRAAGELSLPSVVVTFDPHPAAVVRPGTQPLLLTELDRRADLVAELGVDGFCVLPFTREFSQLSPESFVRDLLVGRLHAAKVVVGENFRFGHRAAGDVDMLAQLGKTFGFEVETVGLAGSESTVFSSTYVRARVDAGDVAAAAEALGRPHRVTGVVVPGAARGGSQLGFPTANLRHDPNLAIPADGVYAGWFVRHDLVTGVDEKPRPTAISVGTNPTFAGEHRTVEAHILDFDGDLYGDTVSVDFTRYIRPQQTFDAIPPLIAQIAADVDRTREILGC
ncbi:bifunctional riboflavin kinase/FAD synthetase [Stackebrandtia soli]|uniref:bifunctional riboflavin kinase/FAD synthetase n=1 Tax=Stackebrandtia soli TaxID=1892856 RepID=UPI0039E9201A